jgi:hypothetical protein
MAERVTLGKLTKTIEYQGIQLKPGTMIEIGKHLPDKCRVCDFIPISPEDYEVFGDFDLPSDPFGIDDIPD